MFHKEPAIDRGSVAAYRRQWIGKEAWRAPFGGDAYKHQDLRKNDFGGNVAALLGPFVFPLSLGGRMSRTDNKGLDYNDSVLLRITSDVAFSLGAAVVGAYVAGTFHDNFIGTLAGVATKLLYNYTVIAGAEIGDELRFRRQLSNQ